MHIKYYRKHNTIIFFVTKDDTDSFEKFNNYLSVLTMKLNSFGLHYYERDFNADKTNIDFEFHVKYTIFNDQEIESDYYEMLGTDYIPPDRDSLIKWLNDEMNAEVISELPELKLTEPVSIKSSL